jgi:hypothetical protein
MCQRSKSMGWEQIGIFALVAAAVVIFVIFRKGGG